MNTSAFSLYSKLLVSARPKKEIIKYAYRRLRGLRLPFDEDVYVTSGNMTLNCGRIMENCTVALGSYEKEIQDELKKTKEGIFIDVGAHIGKHSVTMANHLRNGEVLSFEPYHESYDLLVKNVLANKSIVHHTYCFPYALSNKKGKGILFRDSNHPATNSLIVDRGNGTEVEIKTLDYAIEQNASVGRVSLIKLDCEGSELNVLKGAKKIIKKDHPKIIFEAWNEEAYDTIGLFLTFYGYTIRPLNKENFVAEWN